MKNFENFINEQLSPLQKAYREFFRYMLDKYGVNSPKSLSEEKKKEFFDEIQNSWIKGTGLTQAMQKEMEEAVEGETKKEEEPKKEETKEK
jgi:uncharacterized short protein YbdD (DUF466 family)